MSLYWLQPDWTDAVCACGAKIWPEGDPDWGACFDCFSAQLASDSDGSPSGRDAASGSIACDDSAGHSEAEASPND